jgi:hypothetical protein
MRRGQPLRGDKGETGALCGDEKRGQPAAARVRCGYCKYHVEVGDSSIRDEMLLAIEDPAAVLAPRRGANGRHVGPGFRFGHGERRHGAAGANGVEPSHALCVGPRQHDRHGAKRLQRKNRVGKRAGAGDDFARQTEGAEIARRDRIVELGLSHDPEQRTRFASHLVVAKDLSSRRDRLRGNRAHPLRQLDVARVNERSDRLEAGEPGDAASHH